jgi:SrtB family sortase
VICLVAIGVFLISIGVLALLSPELESAAARSEYQTLREGLDIISENVTDTSGEAVSEDVAAEEIEHMIADEAVDSSLSLEQLVEINNDFIGWMSIRNVLEYPVVLGRDNVRYLNTTFAGHRNSAGAIFMDYRNRNGFDDKVSVIYGHHTWDGSMFAPVAMYLDPEFMQRHPNIVISTLDGRILTYSVFAARLTDAWDMAYTIALLEPERAVDEFPNAPECATSFLLLSTCTRGGSDDERIIVFAAR